jgi:hypothetical protein
MSTRAKQSLTEVALQLRDEQLHARVVHYKADLETNRELDAVTAQVVAQLQELQRVAAREGSAPAADERDRAQVEIELIQSLKTMLQRLFRPGKLASVLERKMAEVSKRFARLFFASELHEKMHGKGGEAKTMVFPEQALFHAFARHEAGIAKELESFEYASPELLEEAKTRHVALVRELRNSFLSRTTPELNQLAKLLNEVLAQFFTQELPPEVGELAWEVVKEARLGDARAAAGYKIGASSFAPFRQAFERRFLTRLVAYCEDEMLKRVRARDDDFRVDTIRFVADPQIFTDVCDLVCDAVYDFLYNDGFLDLPTDWRARLRSAH